MKRAAETIEQRVTRRFYARFKSELQRFSDYIADAADPEQKQQLASLLLIRLMFVRFVQSKGLIGGDKDYLRSKLAESNLAGRDLFYSQTLCALFANDAAHWPVRLFSHQQAETSQGESVQIPDAAFESAFDFFDQYRWRLEEGPPACENEITPDVLGRILELSVNQKQTGAYYTRDDITHHIARNTIIPFLFDSARRQSNEDCRSDAWIWRLLARNPDRYIYPVLKKGAEIELASEIDLIDLAAGDLSVESSDLAQCRLPTERGREMLARRKRLQKLRAKLASGDICGINEVVTCNLDIRRFAQDVLETCECPRALCDFWRAIKTVAVLDLTCGSGAFLFAALNILEPLYEACLERMLRLLREPERCDEASISEMRAALARMVPAGKSSIERAAILKAIVSNNLYGADIMEEAVEICRLRLFLKLAASLEQGQSVEQLSGINFRLCAGDALLGYATCENASDKNDANDRAARAKLAPRNPINCKTIHCEPINRKSINWPEAFPEIIGRGGFDVIIGNPPYMSAAQISGQYAIRNFRTADCPDIYAWALERVCQLLCSGGRSGQIAPLSLTFSRDFDSCRNLIFQTYGENWFSSFARIPSALFNFDVRVRNTIHIGHKSDESTGQRTTRIHRWFEAARPHLFELIEYAPFSPPYWRNKIPKLNTRALSECFERCLSQSSASVAASLVRRPTRHALHFKRSAYNWLSFSRRLPPCYDLQGESVPQTKTSAVYFADARPRDLAFLLLNGKLMLAFWSIVGDDFDLTEWMFADFPINLAGLSTDAQTRLLGLADELENLMNENIVFKLNAGKRVGNYNLARCRRVTDRSDRIFAEQMGIEDAWPDIELLYCQTALTEFADPRKT